jgi:nicotinate phosphoribosyltransferase
VVCLEGEVIQGGETVYDPTNPLRYTKLPQHAGITDLRRTVMADGCRSVPGETLDTMAARCREELSKLPSGCLRLINPHIYKVSISERLKCLRETLIAEFGKGKM